MNRSNGQAFLHAILLGISLTLLAGVLGAADDVDEWGGWGALPDEFLELTDSRDAAELSARLDQLIRDSGGATPRDVILEAWLRQLTQQEGATSLDSLLETWNEDEPPATAEGGRERGPNSDRQPGSVPDSAGSQGRGPGHDAGQGQGAGSGRDSGPGRDAAPGQGSGRSEGRPATPPGRDNDNRGPGNTQRPDSNAPGRESSR